MPFNPKWMFETKGVKELINGDDTKESVFNIVNTLVPQLKIIRNKLPKTNLEDDDKESLDNDLFEIIDNLEFITSLDGKEDEWPDYSFDGNWTELLNNTLYDLYDFGDLKLIDKDGVTRKLLWIG